MAASVYLTGAALVGAIAAAVERSARHETRRAVRTVRFDDALASCTCVTPSNFFSDGTDVRPLHQGCRDYYDTGTRYCYVVNSTLCSASYASSAFPGAHYIMDCVPAPSPPPASSACADPDYPAQWHHPAARIAAAWAWAGGGAAARVDVGNVSLVVVDDGVDLAHPDLDVAEFIAWTTDGDAVAQPAVSVDVTHGTACAGISAAIADNGIGGCGIAPGVRLATAALLSAPTASVFDAAEADSLLHFLGRADVYTNSWGPTDDLSPASMGPAYADALRRVVDKGRGGRGSVVVFAAGNGGRADNSNHDPYTSSRFTIAVAAVGDDDRATWYSEPGANILVAAPSGGGWRGIVTTDATNGDGYDAGNMTTTFGGTSAATPLVAGVVALVLAVRPELGWRDVHGILAASARQNDPADLAWQTNGAGHRVHPYYGFGVVDARAAVELAASWVLVGPEVARPAAPFAPVPSAGAVLSAGRPWMARVDVRASDDVELETVELVLDVVHPARGDVLVTLTSPYGTTLPVTSTFASPLVPFERPSKYTIVGYRGERAGGTWTLRVRDDAPLHDGRVVAATLAFVGTNASTSATPLAPPVDALATCSHLRDEFQDGGCCGEVDE